MRRHGPKRKSRARSTLAQRVLWYVVHGTSQKHPEWQAATAQLFDDLLALAQKNPAISVHVCQVDGIVVTHRDKWAAFLDIRKRYLLAWLCPELRRGGQRLLGTRRHGMYKKWRLEEPRHLVGLVRLLKTLPPLTKTERKRMSRSVPAAVRREVWERDKGACCQCGSQDSLHYDHVLPFSKGGTSKTAKNIQLLCEICNLEKGARL